MKNTIIILITLFFFSCTNVLEKPYNRNKIDTDLASVRKEITNTEYKSLVRYIKIHNRSILGETYQELVNKATYFDGFVERQEKSNKESVKDLEDLE